MGVCGVPQRLGGTVQDITARREAQARMAPAAVRRRVLIEQSREGVMVIEDSGRVAEANPALAAMLARPLPELIGLDLADLGITWSALQAKALRMAPAGSQTRFEASVQRDDGSVIALDVGTNVVALDGIPGLTMSRALLYLPGRDLLFARVLRQFAESYHAGLPELDTARSEEHTSELQSL